MKRVASQHSSRVVIELRFAHEVDNADAADLELLLRDAMGEFVDRRTPARAYVEDRYREMGGAHRAAKVAEVEKRLRWAKALRGKVTIEHPEPEED